MAELGRAALVVCLGLSGYALVAGGWAIAAHRRRLAVSAQNALVAAFVRHDFSLVYVQRLTSRELPLGYTLSAFWGGQEGSLLLWLLVLTGYAGLAVWLNRRSRELVAWTVPVFGLVALF